MAYVAITESLIGRVSSTISERMGLELNTLVNPQVAIQSLHNDPRAVQVIANKLWAGLDDIRGRIWEFNYPLSVSLIVLSAPQSAGGEVVGSQTIMIADAPCTIKREPYENYQIIVHPEDSPAFAEIVEHHNIWAECANRWLKVQEQVVTFLRSCKSLNEAVKLWPDVRTYIPSDALKRLDAKSEKAAADEARRLKALEALKAIDIDNVRTSEVLARMAQGQS